MRIVPCEITFRYKQTDAKTPNIVGSCCVRLHVVQVPLLLVLKWIRLIFYELFKLQRANKFNKYFDQRCYVVCYDNCLVICQPRYKPPVSKPSFNRLRSYLSPGLIIVGLRWMSAFT